MQQESVPLKIVVATHPYWGPVVISEDAIEMHVKNGRTIERYILQSEYDRAIALLITKETQSERDRTKDTQHSDIR